MRLAGEILPTYDPSCHSKLKELKPTANASQFVAVFIPSMGPFGLFGLCYATFFFQSESRSEALPESEAEKCLTLLHLSLSRGLESLEPKKAPSSHRIVSLGSMPLFHARLFCCFSIPLRLCQSHNQESMGRGMGTRSPFSFFSGLKKKGFDAAFENAAFADFNQPQQHFRLSIYF